MKILVFTEKMDYVKVLEVMMKTLDMALDIKVVSECGLANAAVARNHDLIVLDDRLYPHLNCNLMNVLKDSQVDVLVFLERKSNVKRYLSLNLLGYFVPPVNWHMVMERLKSLIYREQLLEYMDGTISGKYVIRHHNAIYFVPFSEILFFEKYEKKVKIHTREQVYDVKDSLKSILDVTPKDFIRVHSSYVVNFSNAEEIIEDHRNYTITFKGYKDRAHMSRKKANELLEDEENHYRLSYIKHIRKD